MKFSNFLEVFFILACGLAMPFIVIGSYFNLNDEQHSFLSLALFML